MLVIRDWFNILEKLIEHFEKNLFKILKNDEVIYYKYWPTYYKCKTSMLIMLEL